MEYDNELHYPDSGTVTAEDNDVRRCSSHFHPLTKLQLKVFNDFKTMQAFGYFPPLKVTRSDVEGFVVVADDKILKGSVITEYCGVVKTLKEANEYDDDDDSLMDLIRNDDENIALVIVPRERGNVAKFISGINNKNKVLARKQNVQSERVVIDGQARVVLYATKDIPAGAQLYYDYNALDKDGFPTENFV